MPVVSGGLTQKARIESQKAGKQVSVKKGTEKKAEEKASKKPMLKKKK